MCARLLRLRYLEAQWFEGCYEQLSSENKFNESLSSSYVLIFTN